ncbi:hypothetical protein LEN26_019255 [Aphanomyces euteiches]|nr:hypothetical protein LEN26_019255 [Aphanomyces euteiches]
MAQNKTKSNARFRKSMFALDLVKDGLLFVRDRSDSRMVDHFGAAWSGKFALATRWGVWIALVHQFAINFAAAVDPPNFGVYLHDMVWELVVREGARVNASSNTAPPSTLVILRHARHQEKTVQ